MNSRRRNTNATRFREERWQREDDAGKLVAAVPTLTALRMSVVEKTGEDVGPPINHTKHFLLQHASAHVELPCTDRKCEGGGYDITHDVLRALRAGETKFEGDAACNGMIGERNCERTIRWTATAGFDKNQADAA
jgi:hypothetical protein